MLCGCGKRIQAKIKKKEDSRCNEVEKLIDLYRTNCY